MSDATSRQPGSPSENGETRRDFLYFATAGTAAVTTGAAVWPLINSMNPAADVVSLSKIDVDLSGMQTGQRIIVSWQGKPVFIWRRSPETIAEARAASLDDLIDPVDTTRENPNHAQDMPALDENRTADEAGEWLILIGVCTHLGCVPLGQGVGEPIGDWGGWFCACHGSQYDQSGRVRRGPAPRNLDIPPYTLSDDLRLMIGT